MIRNVKNLSNFWNHFEFLYKHLFVYLFKLCQKSPRSSFPYLRLRYESSIIYSDISCLHRHLDFEANYPGSKQETINGTVEFLIRISFSPWKIQKKKLDSWRNKPYFMFCFGGDKITVSSAKQKGSGTNLASEKEGKKWFWDFVVRKSKLELATNLCILFKKFLFSFFFLSFCNSKLSGTFIP